MCNYNFKDATKLLNLPEMIDVWKIRWQYYSCYGNVYEKPSQKQIKVLNYNQEKQLLD